MVGIGGRELMGIAVTSYNCLLLPLSVSSSVLLFYSCCPSCWRPWAAALSSKLTPSPKACTLQRNWSLLSLSWTGTTSASLSPIGSSLPGTTPTLLSWSDWRPSERLNDASLVPGSAWKLFECCGWGLGLLVYFVTALAALEWGSCFSFVFVYSRCFFFSWRIQYMRSEFIIRMILLLAMLLIILKQILYFCHCVSVCPPKSLNYLLLKTFTFLNYLCDFPHHGGFYLKPHSKVFVVVFCFSFSIKTTYSELHKCLFWC